MLKGHLISVLTKQFLLLLFLVSAILNFPILDNPKTSIIQKGGYISWPIFYLLEKAFGTDNPLAIKGVIITLLFVLIVWIFYKFNIPVPLPRVNIRLPEQKPLPVRESKPSKSPSSVIFDDTPKLEPKKESSDMPTT